LRVTVLLLFSNRYWMNGETGSISQRAEQQLIYVVDDEPMLLELAKVILEPAGYRVKTFRNAESAVSAFSSEKEPPSLIITDYAMHAMNGIDLIESCRRKCPDQQVLLVSGTVDEKVFKNSRTKPDSFLPKPYQPRKLVELVRDLIG
jgi:DNA-binding NtrC family response regulator